MADQIEKALEEISNKLTEAWRGNNIGELAALAAAVLMLYRENKKT